MNSISQRLLPAPAAETNLLDVDEAHFKKSLDKATFTQSIAEYDAQDLFEVKVEIIRQMFEFITLIQREIGWDGERARWIIRVPGEEPLGRLYTLRDDLKSSILIGVKSSSYFLLKEKVFSRIDPDEHSSA